MLGRASVLVGVEGVKTSELDCSAVGDLRFPLILVGDAVDIDLSGLILEIEAAVLGVEPADLTFQAIILTRSRLLDKCGDSRHGELGIVNLGGLSLSVDGNELASGSVFRSVSLEIDDGSEDNDIVTSLELILCGERHALKVLTPVDLQLDSAGTVGRDVISGVTETRIDLNTDNLSGGVDFRGIGAGKLIARVVCLQALCFLQGCRHIIRAGSRSVTGRSDVRIFSLGSLLGDIDSPVVKVCLHLEG